MSKPNVSIGITAYNEGRTIKSLLINLLKQKQFNYQLNKIVVILDGCTDASKRQVKQVKSQKIFLIDDQKRQGKTFRLNQLLKTLTGDIIIFVDADVQLANDYILGELVRSFTIQPKVGMVGAKVIPQEGKSFISKAIFSSVKAYVSYAESLNRGNNIYTCKGPMIGLSRSFARNITIPKNVFAGDAYLYFFCISRGFKYLYAKKAVVYYKLPEILSEHLKQNARFESADKNLVPIYGDLVNQEFKKDNQLFYYALFTEFIREPVYSLAIMLINLYSRLQTKLSPQNIPSKWSIAKSTKT